MSLPPLKSFEMETDGRTREVTFRITWFIVRLNVVLNLAEARALHSHLGKAIEKLEGQTNRTLP